MSTDRNQAIFEQMTVVIGESRTAINDGLTRIAVLESKIKELERAFANLSTTMTESHKVKDLAGCLGAIAIVMDQRHERSEYRQFAKVKENAND